MDLPIKFPSGTEVILEDVARFRASRRRNKCARSETFWSRLPTSRKYRRRRTGPGSIPRNKKSSRRETSGSFSQDMAIDRNLLTDELGRAVELLAESFAARSVKHAAHRRIGDVAARSESIHSGCQLPARRPANPAARITRRPDRAGIHARPVCRHPPIRPAAHHLFLIWDRPDRLAQARAPLLQPGPRRCAAPGVVGGPRGPGGDRRRLDPDQVGRVPAPGSDGYRNPPHRQSRRHRHRPDPRGMVTLRRNGGRTHVLARSRNREASGARE